jgi:hypothetical protein
MENEQGAVNETVEQTTPTESAPVEKETVNTQQEPVSAITEPEKKVSETVPYDRFKEVNSKLNDPDFIAQKAMELGLIQTQNPADYAPAEMANEMFDQDTVAGIRQLVAQERENERAQEFLEKHGSELRENRLLASMVKDIIRENNGAGKRIDQFKALELAKNEIERLTAPKVVEAKAQGEQEGREVANKKEMLGAVGQPASKQELDTNKMSSKEMAAYYGIKRI